MPLGARPRCTHLGRRPPRTARRSLVSTRPSPTRETTTPRWRRRRLPTSPRPPPRWRRAADGRRRGCSRASRLPTAPRRRSRSPRQPCSLLTCCTCWRPSGRPLALACCSGGAAPASRSSGLHATPRGSTLPRRGCPVRRRRPRARLPDSLDCRGAHCFHERTRAHTAAGRGPGGRAIAHAKCVRPRARPLLHFFSPRRLCI
mmetsp:Transcript_21789/g.68357  ORF Transcript_21789/g.68357 Transcript_21789/m.68357 type:complete len:202 (-) Transcript_21789:33-638(-)